ncbi:MAG TPA: helix-turn-helix domain-containing protein [Lapillicoccus sp.]|nr:helix-turn-helix domain-containing protein [Lapillicoccus sp.]
MSHPASDHPRRPGPAPSLSVQTITAAAVGLADARGLDAVTMREVAGALSTSAAGLYRYVASRDELLAHMVDAASAEVEHPPPTGDWVRDVTVVASRQRDVFAAHPWLGQAVARPLAMGPHVLDHLDWGLAALEPVDAPVGTKLEAIALVTGFAALFASADAGPLASSVTGLDPARHPHLVALAGAPRARSDGLFERVVAGVLRGVLDPG